MAEIVEVEPGSSAAQAGLERGDQVLAVNGSPLRDYIDYQYETAEFFFNFKVKKKNGEIMTIDIEREHGKPLGLTLDGIIFDRLKKCHNNCLFCFVKQQPDDLRGTLLVKDDDYRFSFIQGSFITLTNLGEEEFTRIIEYRISPLNISVHTTNPVLRVKMMGNPRAGRIMELLGKLAGAGISFNTQLVICPGINDGQELDRSIRDLSRLYPQTLSIGVVPVGLTGHREGLAPLNTFSAEGARLALKQIEACQKRLREELGRNILYAADEFYLLAGERIPGYESYHDFPQLENGIGLTRLLWHNFERLEPYLPAAVEHLSLTLITGVLGAEALQPVIRRLKEINGLDLEVIAVSNHFFGQSVTVTGLLTGGDIIRALTPRQGLSEVVILPRVVLNDQGRFLDDLTFSHLVEGFPEKNFFLCDGIDNVVEVITDGKTSSSNCGQI